MIENKFKCYKVGGCVRDAVMGRQSKDIDIVVLAPSYEEMRDEFINSGGKIYQERPEFFTIRGNHPNIGPVDLVLGRKDGNYHDGRHPDLVEVCENIEEELSRRDYTINAMAQDIITNEIIDPFGGTKDIKDKLIFAVGDPKERLQEDVIRLLRAFKFATRLNFNIGFPILSLCDDTEIINLFDKIPKERIYEELKESFDNNTMYMLDIFHRFPKLRDKLFCDKQIKLIPKI